MKPKTFQYAALYGLGRISATGNLLTDQVTFHQINVPGAEVVKALRTSLLAGRPKVAASVKFLLSVKDPVLSFGRPSVAPLFAFLFRLGGGSDYAYPPSPRTDPERGR